MRVGWRRVVGEGK
jgi:hypothetical protein